MDSSSRQIRLLSFREHSGAILSCKLRVYNLENCPPFIALSYTWGEEEDAQHEIRVNGVPMIIRENLRSALDSVRRHISVAKPGRLYEGQQGYDGSSNVLAFELGGLSLGDDDAPLESSPERWKYFWIDAICIDQNNVPERSDQVGLMREIYTSAKFVLVWLGDYCKDSLDFIIKTDPRYLEQHILTGWSIPPIEMEPLIHAEYWSRMWIVQEFVLARTLIVGAGSTFLSWDFIEPLFPPAIDLYRLQYNSYYSMNLIVQERHELPQRREEGFYKSLQRLLERFTLLKCSDQRDKIFALLGLFSDDSEDTDQVLRADYSLEPEELYMSVMTQASLYLDSRRELESLRIFVSSALIVDPDECERMARRVRRGSSGRRRHNRRGGN